MRDPAALLEALVAQPDDLETLRVYADVLLEHGDLRGELIGVQLARLAGDTPELRAREAELVDHVEPELQGALASTSVLKGTWKLGFLDRLMIQQVGDEPIEATLIQLAAQPAARRLRRIAIYAVAMVRGGELAPAITELARLAPAFPRLTAIALSIGSGGSADPDPQGTAGALAPLAQAYPGLEEIALGSRPFQLCDLALPALRHLWIQEVRPGDVAALAAARLPALEELDLWFGAWAVADPAALLEPLLGRVQPALVTLAIGAAPANVLQHLARAVPGSTLAQRVRVLAFRRSVLDDACVQHLVAWAPRLRALERLEVAGRRLSVGGRRLLEQTFGATLVVR
ncbi:MAG: TIGR02996 domain-containing protein [Myxococcota bacterium]|nr:TIGR02996 domain-containing protein [Myxococcota bacterium]